MSLNRYIVVSILFHFMLLSLLTITHPVQKGTNPVFNVSIIEPFETQTPKSPPQNITEEIKTTTKKPPARFYSRPKPAEISKPPETIYGDDIESTQPSLEEVEKSKGSSVTEEGNPPPSNDRAESSSGKINPKPYVFLFDRETIEKFAKRPSTEGRGLTFNAPEFKHRGYMRMLKQRIESIWIYPKEAIRQGISGDLYVRFSIKRDGSLGDVELIRTSGHRSLDEAALKAIREAEPFWPLPEGWQKDDLIINGHFIYILGETFVM